MGSRGSYRQPRAWLSPCFSSRRRPFRPSRPNKGTIRRSNPPSSPAPALTGDRIVDYQTAENQAVQLQQQADQVGQAVKALAEKLQAKISDPTLARELMLDLRETALGIQRQNQSALMLIQQMAEYIHSLETHVDSLPQQTYPTRG